MSAVDLQILLGSSFFIAISWLIMKYAEYQNRWELSDYASELVIAGKVSDYETALHLVRSHFDYSYNAE